MITIELNDINEVNMVMSGLSLSHNQMGQFIDRLHKQIVPQIELEHEKNRTQYVEGSDQPENKT